MPDDIVLAIDQGSSNTRCIAFDGRLRQLASAMRPVSTLRPAPGMVEHDPQELLAGALEAVAEARAGVGGDVAAVGIANQTESFVLWDAESGAPASAVVSWQDQRAAGLCEALSDRPGASRISEATGLTLDPTFSAPKLMWLFERDEGLRARAEAGELLLGDVACWLAWHMARGSAHVTEPSNACRTLLVDLATLRWDGALLELFAVPPAMLPEIRPSDASGLSTSADAVGFDAPIAAMLGDQPAALYGQGCTSPGMAALTLGTGAFVWLNVGPERPQPPPGVLATAAWQRADAGTSYALEAFGANAGNALAVLRDMGFASADGASPAPDWDRPHPIVVPAPAGLGTPRWHGVDRITVLGATSATTPADLAAAGVAGVAHQIVDALEAIGAARPIEVLRVGGGLAAYEGLVQAVADLSGGELEVAADLEATARGIAALAADAAGILDPGAAGHSIARRISPQLADAGREVERARWQDALDVHVRPQAGP